MEVEDKENETSKKGKKNIKERRKQKGKRCRIRMKIQEILE